MSYWTEGGKPVVGGRELGEYCLITVARHGHCRRVYTALWLYDKQQWLTYPYDKAGYAFLESDVVAWQPVPAPYDDDLEPGVIARPRVEQ
jgi:hypothetical protein